MLIQKNVAQKRPPGELLHGPLYLWQLDQGLHGLHHLGRGLQGPSHLAEGQYTVPVQEATPGSKQALHITVLLNRICIIFQVPDPNPR